MKKQNWKILLAAGLVLTMAGCGKKAEPAAETAEDGSKIITAENGFAYGSSGDVMQTQWFTVQAGDASVLDSYEDVTPAEGNKLLVVPVTVTNTCDTDLSMYDVDFQVQWDDDSEEAFAAPVTVDDATRYRDGMLQDSYVLAVKESRSGDLVFEVPADSSGYTMLYQEVFETSETGDIFVITLNVK